MAKTERRNILKAGALAIGAALLPRSAAAETAAPSGDDYQRTIEAVAEALRPGFQAGEFRGYRYCDDSAPGVLPRRLVEYEVIRHVIGVEPPAPFTRFVADEPTIRRACWVLLHSPSTRAAIDANNGVETTVEEFAVEAASYDVFRIARQRGWYVPTDDEMPSNEALGIAS